MGSPGGTGYAEARFFRRFWRSGFKYCPVWLPRHWATASGGPATTISPPERPASGPKSTTQSAHLITSKWCSIRAICMLVCKLVVNAGDPIRKLESMENPPNANINARMTRKFAVAKTLTLSIVLTIPRTPSAQSTKSLMSSMMMVPPSMVTVAF